MVILLFYAFLNANPQNNKPGKKPKKTKKGKSINTKSTIWEKLMKQELHEKRYQHSVSLAP